MQYLKLTIYSYDIQRKPYHKNKTRLHKIT